MIPATRLRPRTGTVDAVVVGAGHSGLGMGRCLADLGIEHVVLERGEIAHSWRHERWDSLRLLTPSWQSRLPGYRYSGPDPDGYMTCAEVVEFIDAYAKFTGAPVRSDTTVTSIVATESGYLVVTDRGRWRCRAVVLANGAHALPAVPAIDGALPTSITRITANRYRSPERLDDRGVLVVGASATGLQLADEIQRSGRQVTLAVGEHIRVPRTYRGKDIQWWLDAAGILDERYDEVDDIVRARRVPSPQLVGSPEREMLDLNTLTEHGVRIVGRLCGVSRGKAQFSGSLRNHCAMADLKLNRLLDRLDDWAATDPRAESADPVERFPPTRAPEVPHLDLDLEDGRVGTVLWATGFRPDYGWLHVPVFDHKGRLRHDGGVVAPGLYVLGLNFMRRRKSSYIHGAEDDARELSGHMADYLRARATALSASVPRSA